jgi:hypothetical protein
MTPIAFFVAIAALLLVWLLFAQRRLLAEKRAREARRDALRSRRQALVTELHHALPKDAGKLNQTPSRQELQAFFSSLTTPSAKRVHLVREELASIDEKLGSSVK